MTLQRRAVERGEALPLMSVDLVRVLGAAEVLPGPAHQPPGPAQRVCARQRILKDARCLDALARFAHRIDVPAGFEVPGIDDPHAALRWWSIAEAAASADMHRYTRDHRPLAG